MRKQHTKTISKVSPSVTKKRKKVSNNIQQSVADISKIFSVMTELIYIIDKNGIYLDIISTQGNEVFKPAKRLLGKSINDIFLKNEADILQKSIKKVLRNNTSLEIEYEFEIKKKKICFSATISPLNRFSVLVVARDITKQKLYEESKLEIDLLYKKLMEESNDAIFIADAKNGSIINANVKAQKLIGRSLSELKKMHQSELHPKRSRKIIRENFKEIANSILEKKEIVEIIHKDGYVIPVEVSSSVIELRGKKIVQGIFRDVSKQLRIENELRAQKSFFEQLFLQSSFSTQILDKDGWCLRINPKLTELFGVKPNDIEGKQYNIFKDQSIIDSGVIKHLNKVFKEAKSTEWIVNFDIAKAANSQNIKVTKREKRWFKNKAYPILDLDGKIKNVVIQHEDITATRESDEKIKILAQSLMNITECVSITDLNDNIIYANEAFLNTYGYKENELIGKNISIVRPENNSTGYIKNINPDTMKGGWNGELLNKDKNGVIFPIQLSTSVVKDENNTPIALIGVAVDITDRKKQEKTLRESEEKYRSLAEASQDMIYIIDRNDNIIYLNTYAASQFRVSPDEIIGKKRSEILGGNQNERQYKAIKKVFETKKASFIESEVQFPGKNLFIGTWLVPITNPDGKIVSVMGVSRDITERIVQEIQLRKFSRAVEQSPVSIVITNIEGNIEYVNPIFSKITRYSFEEVLGKNPRILKSGENPDSLYKNLWLTISAGKIWKGELHNKKKNGELFWEYASISPIFDKNGKIINYIAVKENITERKIAELELLAAKEKAEEMNSLKTKFLANMSHELRTPLIGVLGYAEILREELKTDEKKKMADTIYISGKRLLHTLNLLLDLSRIEANKEELSITKTNVSEVVQNSVRLFEPIAQSKNLKISAFVRNEIIASLDERIFEQIINNLINNAIKYTDEGFISVEVELENYLVVLKIKDTGIGIPDDKKEIIFEEFRQVSEGLSRRHQGTGLGLTITKKYVDLLNGSISVKNNLEKGSVFIVKLPC
ncbi:MAG TPA: PAS domain S-box protein [Ignavibacteriaceae bacterium]|nr:PAS domain S-box protein [Ignavibacteriaceae bacterium]